MSTDIRASLSLATMDAQAARSDSGAQNQILDIGSDGGFPQVLEQQANARAESRAAPANDFSRVKEREEAAARQSGGKRLPAGADKAGERRAEARRTERADARERDEAAASQRSAESHAAEDHAAACRDAESARRLADEREEKIAGAEDKNADANGNGALVAPPVDPAAATAVVVLPDAALAAADAAALAQQGESDVMSDAAVLAPALPSESTDPAVTEIVATPSVGSEGTVTVAESAATTAQPGIDAELLAAAAALLEAGAQVGEDAAAASADAETVPMAPAAIAAPSAETPALQPAVPAGNAEQLASAASSRPVSLPESTPRTTSESVPSAMSSQAGAVPAAENGDLSGEAEGEASGESASGEKSAGPGADADKGNRAVPERVAAFREQLAALAQQVDADNRAAGAGTKKSDSTQDIKGFALTRNMEQLSTARADAGKTASTGIQTLLTNREWAGEVGQRLLMMVSSKIKSAEIHLNPKELGPMEVRIRMHEDKAHVVFTSQVAQTREALEQAVPRLREMLDQNGVTLGNVNVQDHGAQHSHQRQQPDQQTGGDARGNQVADETDVAPVIRRDLSLVDFYA